MSHHSLTSILNWTSLTKPLKSKHLITKVLTERLNIVRQQKSFQGSPSPNQSIIFVY